MGKRKSHKIYALYKGEEFICDGSLDEIEQKTHLKKTTLIFYGTPTYKKRNHKGNYKALVRIE